MSCNSVLRIGPTTENASAALVRNALVSYFETSSEKSNSVDEGASELTVTNRYFSARVLLEDLGSGTQGKEDGIILVFDAVKSNPGLVDTSPLSSSFDSLNQVHEQAERDEQCGELLRLCVGVSLGELGAKELRGEKYEEEYSRRVLWCLDRGYEYVEADLSLEGQQTGHDEREKDGFARIVEAVNGTMWSSAVMKQTTKKDLVRSYHEGSQENATKSSTPYAPSSVVCEDAFSKPDVVPEANMSKNDLNKSATAEKDSESVENKENGDPVDLEARRKEQVQEEAFDSLERVIGEAKRIREASKSGMLSDEDRRKRAGDAAMLMMGLMDKLNFDDDSEDASDRSSEDEGSDDA